MEKKLPPKETGYSDLNGIISINLEDEQDFNSLGASIAGYSTNRFQAVAMRVYITKTPVVTIFAMDKEKEKKHEEKKIPVHKFKVEMSLDELFYKIKNVNFTVTAGDYTIADMEVQNK